MSRKIRSRQEYIDIANNTHNFKYDYSLWPDILKSGNERLDIICHKHGKFSMLMNNHLRGKGCYFCSLEKRTKWTLESWKEKCISLYNGKYNYDNIKIMNNVLDKVLLTCPIHGEFLQTFGSHKSGHQCLKCGYEKVSSEKRITGLNEFLKIKHKNKYDYSLIDYKRSDRKIQIICPKHGIFSQTPKAHMNGAGCSKCSNNVKTKEEVLNDFYKLYGKDKYNYDLFIEYKNLRQKIKIKCNKCNIFFEKSVGKHLIGRGCPRCKKTFKGEKKIEEYLINNSIDYKTEYSFNDCRDKNPLRFDFYLPDLNICIEYDGIGHYKPLGMSSNKESMIEGFEYMKRHDKIKTSYCLSSNIPLIRIPYWDFDNIPSILSSNLLSYQKAI
jgi:hypothetical protein